MAATWLQRKRKGELLELAQEVNMPDADGLLKDDLVEALHNYLESNETRYGKLATLSEYYNKRTSSPIKRERMSPDVQVEVPVQQATTRRRRTTLKSLASDELEPKPEESRPLMVTRTPEVVHKALATRTPRSVTRVTSPLARVSQSVSQNISQVDLPATPAQLAEVADQSFQAAKEKANELWEKTRVEETVESVRESASSVVFIQLAMLFIEAAGLQWNTLQTMHVFNAPAAVQPYVREQAVKLPDPAMLLTSGFWAPATLWSLTSWALPLLFSYFFNLTLRSNTHQKSPSKQYTVDPLTFNIARALLAYSAYSLPVADVGLVAHPGVKVESTPGWGPFGDATIHTIRENVPGGYYGLQIGSVIGVLYSLYDAALKK